MGRFIALCVCALLIVSPARAQDFGNAAAAYKRGDYATALEEWRALAEKGEARSQFMVGALYAAGKGVPRDYAEAAQWYRKAARQGLAAAQNNLGFLYDRGLGVAQDPHLAVNWYLRAARQGHAQAQNNLGVMYGTGRGVPPDRAEALKWFRLAAAQDNPQAHHNIAMLKAEKGEAVAKAAPPAPGRKAPARVVSITEESVAPGGKDSGSEGPQAVANTSDVLFRPKEPKLETIVSKKTPRMLLLAPKKGGSTPNASAADRPDVARQKEALKKLKQAKSGAGTKPEVIIRAAVEPTAPVTREDGPKFVTAPKPAPTAAEEPLKSGTGQAVPGAKDKTAAPPAKGPSPLAKHSAAQKKRFQVQLGALKTGKEAKAKAAAARLMRAHKKALGDLKVSANRADLGKRGVYYRLRAGPVADLKAAKALCKALSARKQPCLVIQP